MSWSGLVKLLSGFLIAIALIVGGSVFAAQYLITQFTAAPPKPVFPNDKPAPKPKAASAPKAKTVAAAPSPKPSPEASPSPSPEASPSPSPEASATPAAKPPKQQANEYKARISLSEGLNLRSEPSRDGARIGGVDYNDEVTVLENSADGEWQRVRIEATGDEGWIKAGYANRTN